VITIYLHETGLAWSSYLINRGRINEVPRLHIADGDHSTATICGTKIGRFWVPGEDQPFEPTEEILAQFDRNKGLVCRRCVRSLRKQLRAGGGKALPILAENQVTPKG